MTDFCIVESGTIKNMIVCDSDDVAAELGALPGYEGAAIGLTYDPPPVPDPPEEPIPADMNEMAVAVKQDVILI